MKIAVFYNHIVQASKQTGLSIKQLLPIIHSYGITGLEFDVNEIKDNEANITQLLSENNFFISSIYTFHHFEKGISSNDALWTIDLAKRMKVKKVLIIPGFCRKRSFFRKRSLHRIVTALVEVCKYADTKGIQVSLEDFGNIDAPYCTTKGLCWFIEKVPHLAVTYDSGNFKYCLENELEAFEKFKDHIVHVHLKDCSFKAKNGEPFQRTLDKKRMYPSAVGYGCVAMKEILKRLSRIGYVNAVTIEHFGAKDQLKYIELSAKWISEHLNNPEIE